MSDLVASVKELSQGYPGRRVISSLDLELRPGVLGLLGPNGAGKTTLLRTLATVAPPQAGQLRVCGQQVSSAAEARRARRHIGYLPQAFGYFPSFSVYDFVRYCAWLREVPAREAHRATMDAIDLVGLSERKDAKLKTLSGGMRQRCGIAQAIVGKPRLLLLDEPTVGLDPEQRLEFRDVIRKLTDVAVVVSTHLVEEVTALCDQVAVMNAGRLVFRGSPDDLVAVAPPGARGDTPVERGYLAALAEGEVRA